MFASRKREHTDAGDPSALDALLDAERGVAASLQDAARTADRMLREARAAAHEADEREARDLTATVRSLDEEAARQRDEDARAVRAEAERRRRLYAGADDAWIAVIAERLAEIVAPAAPTVTP